MIETTLTWEQKVSRLAVELGRVPTLDELLKLGKAHNMSLAELKAQRESWVQGELDLGSDADEAKHRKGAEK